MRPNQKQIAKTVGVYTVRMVRESQLPWDGNKIHHPVDVVKLIRAYFTELDREHFIVVLLSSANQPIGFHTVSIGTLNESLVSPREVFKTAILGSVARIIVAHNHPSGNTSPSAEDIQVSRQLKQVGELLRIKLADSIIVGVGGQYHSMEECNEL
jgi:DNA repair protein RadC